MDNCELQVVLCKHKKWRETLGLEGERANLEDANLRGANLEDANLRGANIFRATLSGSTMINVNIDFPSIPVSCGGLNYTIDKKMSGQLLYHVMNLMKYSNMDLDSYFKDGAFDLVNNGHLQKRHGLKNIKKPKTEEKPRAYCTIHPYKGRGL
ncbi:pentapeptide repeat-containing protein [Methanobrevibacter sp. DSM 116169]|uniref:pentapeptide repeat-containing protein n=1 Tax=Methanobrevibacter sp. DSM 116169 TaxID=3242727 RepID=UPI0038FC8144